MATWGSAGRGTCGRWLWPVSGYAKGHGRRTTSGGPRGRTWRTPGQWSHRRHCPHLLRGLQVAVDQAGLPMWLLGQCQGTTAIIALAQTPPQARSGPAAPTHATAPGV